MWQFLNKCEECGDNSPCSQTSTNNVQYIGPTLPCSGIETKDSLTTIIQKLEAKICLLTPNYLTYKVNLYFGGDNLITIDSIINEINITPTVTHTGVGINNLIFNSLPFIPRKISVLMNGVTNIGFIAASLEGSIDTQANISIVTYNSSFVLTNITGGFFTLEIEFYK